MNRILQILFPKPVTLSDFVSRPIVEDVPVAEQCDMTLDASSRRSVCSDTTIKLTKGISTVEHNASAGPVKDTPSETSHDQKDKQVYSFQSSCLADPNDSLYSTFSRMSRSSRGSKKSAATRSLMHFLQHATERRQVESQIGAPSERQPLAQHFAEETLVDSPFTGYETFRDSLNTTTRGKADVEAGNRRDVKRSKMDRVSQRVVQNIWGSEENDFNRLPRTRLDTDVSLAQPGAGITLCLPLDYYYLPFFLAIWVVAVTRICVGIDSEKFLCSSMFWQTSVGMLNICRELSRVTRQRTRSDHELSWTRVAFFAIQHCSWTAMVLTLIRWTTLDLVPTKISKLTLDITSFSILLLYMVLLLKKLMTIYSSSQSSSRTSYVCMLMVLGSVFCCQILIYSMYS